VDPSVQQKQQETACSQLQEASCFDDDRIASGRSLTYGTPMKSLRDIVAFYREFGFFGSDDIDAAIKRIQREYTSSHGESPDPQDRWLDVFLFEFDRDRVWCDDPEADVCQQNNVYTEVIPEWARTSLGCFAPTNIVESWLTESGPVTIRFELDDATHSIRPAYLDDWIDLDVLSQINVLIADSGRRFEYFVDGNYSIVFSITPEERSEMIKVRDFPFAL
jgi:hypothetical protein